MGCVASRINKEERVRACKQRKKLMKQLVGFRREFADSQLAYLRALKNTGATLRQFTESESLDVENINDGHALALPSSPILPMPPSPPLPPFLKKDSGHIEEVDEAEIMEFAQGDMPPPPQIRSSSWEPWSIFDYPSEQDWGNNEIEEPEEENWAETNTEFEEEEPEEEASKSVVARPLTEKPLIVGSVDDNSSTMSSNAKDPTDTALILWRRKKTLEGIAKELDDYFLKASAGVKEITLIMDIGGSDRFQPRNSKENKRKRCNKAKVFSALSWSWSSKSLQFTRGSVDSSGSREPCRPGAHCDTLKMLYEEESKLYKEVKEEVITRLEHERKYTLLIKQEEENHDWTKTEKTRSAVESLEADIMRLQQSISRTCSSVLQLIDDELYPQLGAITSGLLHMWRTMCECHQAQYQIAQLLNHLTENQKLDLSTAYHRQAAAQLENEVICWYNSFCRVVKSQREYVRALCGWIKLTDTLVDGDRQSLHSSAVHSLCERWQLALDSLPDKVTSEAIKDLCSAIHMIVLRMEEEHNLHRKYDKLERRLQKEMDSLDETKRKHNMPEDGHLDLTPKHPLVLKQAKAEFLKKQVDDEKDRYVKSVQVTKTMTLSNLKTSLPNVFKKLMDFSNGYVAAVEGVCSPIRPADSCDDTLESSQEN